MSDIRAAGSPSAPGKLSLPGLSQSKVYPPKDPPGEETGRQKRRAAFYVDGFNLYHALKNLGDKHLRWLDLSKLANELINKRDETVVKIVWCSAEYRKSPAKMLMHRTYRAALVSVGVVPILGHFVPETLKCKATCGEKYAKDTEKASDVNVGIYAIADAYANVYDHCYLISADSDQAGVVDMFQQRLVKLGKQITVVAPPGKPHSYNLINRTGVFHASVSREAVEKSLFPKSLVFKDGSGSISRPSKYDPPAGWKKPGEEKEIIKPRAKDAPPVVVQHKRRKPPNT